MDTNIIKDVSTLTTISEKTLAKLNNIYIYSINEAVEESILNNDTLSNLDIGIGILSIYHDNDEIKFKFKPSAKLEESLINTIINKQNLLEVLLENTLINRITNTYKDLL